MWLKEGDRNSKYFHRKASFRRQKNISILKLQNEMGDWQEGTNMEEHIINYFKSFFSASKLEGQMDFLEFMAGRVTVTINDYLSKEFMAIEVFIALQQMPLIFFKKH